MELAPKDSASYAGSPVEFVDADNFAHVVGCGLRVASASSGKASDFVFTDATRGISCFGVSHRSRTLAIAKRTKPPSIDVVAWPSKDVKCCAAGGAELEFGAVALSRLGERLAGVSHLVDHRLYVWDVPSAGLKVPGQLPTTAVLVAEANLPFACSLVAFNPADSTMLATASHDGGLLFWKLARSHGLWHLTSVEADCKALPPPVLPEGGTTDRSISDDGHDEEDEEDEEVSLAEATAAKARIAAIAWGIGGELFAGNTDGVIGRFNADTGALLSSYNQGPQNGVTLSRVVGLIFTKQYLIVATLGKLVYWLKCPEFDAIDHTATIYGIANGPPPETLVNMACSPSYTKFVVGTVEGTLHSHHLDPPAEPSGIPDVMPIIGEYANGFILASTTLTVAKSMEDMVAMGSTDGSLRLFWAESSAPAATRVYRSEELQAEVGEPAADNVEEHSPGGNPSASSNPGSPVSSTSPKAAPPSPSIGEKGEVGFDAPGISVAAAGTLPADDEPADPHSLPPVAVTCLAALPGHPVLAVGLASGQLSMLYVHHEDKNVVTLPLDLKTLGREPLTHLAFSRPLGATPALLAAACAAEGSVFVMETSHSAADFTVVAIIALSPPGVRVMTVAWAETDILLVTGSDGSVATYAVPRPEDYGDTAAVASSPLQPLALQGASSIAGQAAAASGGFSAAIPAAGGLFVSSPGNRGLVVNAALPDRDTFESKATLAEPDAIPALTLKAKRTVVSHAKGISCAALSCSGDMIATGGVDGLVVLWKLGKGGASKIAASQLHAAPVVSLSFARSDMYLVSVGLDRSSFISQVVNGKPFVKKDTAIAFLANARKRATTGISFPVVTGKSGEEKPEEPNIFDLNGPLPVKGTQPTFLEQFAPGKLGGSTLATSLGAAAAHDVSNKDLSTVQDFKDRLEKLLVDNDRATGLEKMERAEFVVDVLRRDAAVAKNEQEAEAVRNEVKDEDAVKDIVSARIRAQCVHTMEQPAMEVQAMQAAHTFVTNMPLVLPASAARDMLEKCKSLRLMELKEMQLAGVFEYGHPTAASDGVWPGRRNEVPPNASWIINECSLAPVLDLVSSLNATDEAPGTGGEGGDADGATKSASTAGGDDGEDLDGEGSRMSKINMESILTYLYPPTALKTPNQKRMQVVFLNELVRQLKAGFNKHFDKLHGGKQDEMEKIQEKNERICEILHDLQSGEDYFTPTRVASEMPESFLDVEDAEMSCRPYETEATKKAKAAEAEEKARREAEAKKDNIGERALNDMMYGTLEVKKEGVLEMKLQAMPEWMNTLIMESYEGDAEAAVSNMEPEQVKEYEEYEVKKTAFEEAQRTATKALELELKRLKTEVADIAKSFDESVRDLSRRRVQVQLAVCTQELYMLRVGLGLMESEDELVAKARLEATLTALVETKEDLDEQSARWTVQVDAMKERLTELQDIDRTLEKDFKKTVVEPAIEAVNQEQLKTLSALYRLRKTAASGPGSQGSRMSGSRISGRGSLRRSSVVQGSGRRSLADAAAGLVGARRSSRNPPERGSGESTGAMGSLQKAMAEAREAAAAENDPFRDSDRKAEKTKALSEQMGVNGTVQKIIEVAQLDIETDCPHEGFRCEDAVWDKLNELRTQKIRSETAVKALQVQYSDMKKQSDAIQAKDATIEAGVATLQAQIEKLEDKLNLSDRNLEVMIKIKQGQNELLQQSVVTDFSNGVLVNQGCVMDLNNRIKALGAEKVRVLHKIKNFRKSINYMQWEENFMQVSGSGIFDSRHRNPAPRLPPNLTHAFLLFPALFANVY